MMDSFCRSLMLIVLVAWAEFVGWVFFCETLPPYVPPEIMKCEYEEDFFVIGDSVIPIYRIANKDELMIGAE